MLKFESESSKKAGLLVSTARDTQKEAVHLRISYLDYDHPSSAGAVNRNYMILKMIGKELEENKPVGSVIWQGMIPEPWQKEIQMLRSENLDSDGNISYTIKSLGKINSYDILAKTSDYRPKGDFLIRSLVGFPYFAEWVTTSHLREEGITYISTSSAPEIERVNQLTRIGLPVDLPVRIERWESALLQGFEQFTLASAKRG